MFRKPQPPKYILFIGENNPTIDYIAKVVQKSVEEPDEKVPTYTFTVEEPDFYHDLHPGLLKKTDGAIFLINSTKMDNLSIMKEYLWEHFVWNENARDIPVLIASYHAEKAIALTTSEIIEAFSLIRLTDRLWNVMEIRENKEEDILACFKWLDSYIDVLGVKEKITREK
ncbi:MAG: ADP-ribosylation factor-like protein [Asgard group archaeon]|nr:ADP-ribosylation factor-like protein [Asgard group archaeon]